MVLQRKPLTYIGKPKIYEQDPMNKTKMKPQTKKEVQKDNML